ncbi:hypothetical protein IWQ61_003687 [Dispira simplex]|nr:hypothetical protein IWQ61_003687 [Dispira simplex]
MATKANFIRVRRVVIRFMKKRYPMDRTSFIFIACLLAFWGLTYYFMNVMANVASYRSSLVTQHQILPDLGFEVIPHIRELWLTDFFDALMFAPTAIMVTFFRPRPNYVLVKGLMSSAICNLLRITTMAITSLPDPREGCEFVLDDFWSTFQLHRCGDCIFSGHTIIFVLCTMVWVSHAPRNFTGFVGIFFALSVCVAGTIIVVANRAHYTVDVLLAWYIGISVWFTVSRFWDGQIVRRGLFPTINFPDPELRNNGKLTHLVYMSEKITKEDSQDIAIAQLASPGSNYSPVAVV